MAFITIAGQNQIAAKQGAGLTLNVANFVLANVVGLGAEPADRIEAMPAGGDIVATLPVTTGGYVNTNQVIYSLVMDSTVGDFDFNWVGLVDADGVLISVTYTPLIEKRKTVGATQGNNLTRNFLIAFSGIAATTAIAVPAATWQIDFNARLLGIDERERLSNGDPIGHEGFYDAGWQIVRQGATTIYDVLPGTGYIGGVRVYNATTQQVTVSAPPKAVWMDVSMQGDISDMSAVVVFVIDAATHADYTDANGVEHYLAKIADISSGGVVTDRRVSATFPPSTHSHSWTQTTGKPVTFPPSAHSHSWAQTTGKPTTFAPSAHNHLWSEIDSKPVTFPASAHSHSWAQTTGKPATFPASAHSHSWTQTTGKPTTFAPSAHNHLWSEINSKPATFPPSAHSHTDLQTSIDHEAAGRQLADQSIMDEMDLRSSTTIKTKVIDIGAWNMVSHSHVVVPHGLEYNKIRALTASIYRDDNATLQSFHNYDTNETSNHLLSVSSTNVILVRANNGNFNNTAFSSVLINRGYIIISYI